ncbi:gliding motility protein [Streptomyces sp. NPDC088097]|uniref:gliding motility protein n=1 Tax=Streptomyces sp. NPDC088097 TaxID=3365823 RepID=UPI00381402FE
MTEAVAAETEATEELAADTASADETEEAGTVAAATPAAEAVEIPKQQSAEVAADSEAGEAART